ncbi:response regulator transcription factor [Enterococcus sp. 669A]|uniref:Response regulator transcription factor n=1 Tax=Candidatus Enterococcus moelleringii TaxID=2815325 RepID=A0ABS3LD98_9ENTE|nr:response regulator transcription factor [Enterococcus sp. 669A]MBO1307065.1 response regulator transcription factor [Enterococcus sp. 669A]
MKRIMIVEDDLSLSEGVRLAIASPENEIFQYNNLEAAQVALFEQTMDLILLDINLPDGNGLDFLKEVKATTKTPVILLTANDTEMDVVLGLEYGADDYITKPFSLAILRARVNTQLRRSQEKGQNLITIDAYCFDFDKMEFSKDDQPIELSKTEQRLLRLLVENRGATVMRETLLEKVWGSELEFVDSNTLSVTIKRLRDKLKANEYIKTVYGIGYSWVVN